MIKHLNHQLIKLNFLEIWDIKNLFNNDHNLNYNTAYKCNICNKLIFNYKDKWWGFNGHTFNHKGWSYEDLTCEEYIIKKLLE